jgi:hypothetical protein
LDLTLVPQKNWEKEEKPLTVAAVMFVNYKWMQILQKFRILIKHLT